ANLAKPRIRPHACPERQTARRTRFSARSAQIAIALRRGRRNAREAEAAGRGSAVRRFPSAVVGDVLAPARSLAPLLLVLAFDAQARPRSQREPSHRNRFVARLAGPEPVRFLLEPTQRRLDLAHLLCAQAIA